MSTEQRADASAPNYPDAAQSPTRYFVYDNDCGYEEFATDDEREKAHQKAIEGYLDDGWSEEVTSVVSGIVTHETVQVDLEHKPNPCAQHPEHEDEDCAACEAWNEYPNHDFDTCCKYVSATLAAPVAPAADAQSEDAEHMATIDIRDLFAFLRAAWREGQHYDRVDIPDQADSWSAASDYANKVIGEWTGRTPAAQPVDPFRKRVERLLVELHNEDRLSEGQCAKVLDIDRISWREIADEVSLERPTAARPDKRAAFTSALILEICELPDRTSPEDEPSAMVANADEIASCVERACESAGLRIVSVSSAHRGRSPARSADSMTVDFTFLYSEEESLNELMPIEVLHGKPIIGRETVEPCQQRMLDMTLQDRYRRVALVRRQNEMEAADCATTEAGDAR